MPFILIICFLAWTVASTFLQASHNPLKNWVSPGLTAVCSLVLLYGAFAGTLPLSQGVILAIALIMLAGSDFTFERSVSKPGLFPLAMGLGVLSGLTIGILLNVVAYWANIPPLLQVAFFGVGGVAAAVVYRYLQVDPTLRLPVYIYLVQAVILLGGGLSSLYVGYYAFAIWGIFIFLSDSLVGLRAFPNPQRPITWLDEYRILLAILLLYYPAQFALVAWAVGLSS